MRPTELKANRRLQVGDLLCVSAHRSEPAVVCVAEEPKYLAWPYARRDGALMVKLAGELPPVGSTTRT